MATQTPPPYFPQGSLAPPDEGRYRRFKIIVAGIIGLLLLVFGGIAAGAVYLLKWLF